MNWFSNLLRRQWLLILKSDAFALLNVLLLAVLPYTGWLAATIIAFVTLRKGWRSGSVLMLSAVAVTLVLLHNTFTQSEAMVGALIAYLPSYLAAGTLRATRSWRAVAAALFAQVLLVMVMLHALAPDYIIHQYQYLQEMLGQLQLGDTLSALNKRLAAANATEQLLFANYLVGMQALGVVLSTVMSLMLARFVQSRLFYRDGFKQEMLYLRGATLDIFVLLLLLFGVRQHYLLAVNCLPVMLFFFFSMGLSLWFDCMSNRSLVVALTVSAIIPGFFPRLILPCFIVLGSLDVFINFRQYLPKKSG